MSGLEFRGAAPDDSQLLAYDTGHDMRLPEIAADRRTFLARTLGAESDVSEEARMSGPADPAGEGPDVPFDYRLIAPGLVTEIGEAALADAEALVLAAVEAVDDDQAVFADVIGRLDQALGDLLGRRRTERVHDACPSG